MLLSEILSLSAIGVLFAFLWILLIRVGARGGGPVSCQFGTPEDDINKNDPKDD